MAQNLKPDRVYRLWESTQDIIEFSRWLPEVVGTEGELRRIGSILVAKIPQDEDVIAVDIEVKEPLRFRDADVSKYRNLLSFFRRNHGRKS
jgi:hypothetical protein